MNAQRLPMASSMRLSLSMTSDRSLRNSPSGTYECSDSIASQPLHNFLGLIKPFPNAREDIGFYVDVQSLAVCIEKNLCGCVRSPSVSTVEGVSLCQADRQNARFHNKTNRCYHARDLRWPDLSCPVHRRCCQDGPIAWDWTTGDFGCRV
jgi:hypothetical protein